MAKNQASAAVSLNPSDMLQGGLKDDFRGKITEAVYCSWDYEGKIDTPVLGVRLTIEDPEEPDKPVVQTWPAGNLEAFRPSEDGKNPVDDDDGTGPYAVRVGNKAQLNNNTNFAHLMETILDCGKASKKFTEDDLTGSLECLVGLDAQWNRVAQKKRAGLLERDGGEEGGRKRPNDILVVTEVFGYGDEEPKSKKGGKAAPPAAKKGKAKPEPEEDEADEAPEKSELDEALEAAVLEAIANADGELKKSKLPPIIIKAFAKDAKNKSKAVKRVMETEFLENGPWSWDEDEGTLSNE